MRIAEGIRGLTPGYFAFVMATGIISIGLATSLPGLSTALLVIAAIGYGALIIGNVVRALRYPEAMLADLGDPARSFGFFTFVAATCVLGSRLVGDGAIVAGLVLLTIGAVAWIILGYTVPALAVRGREVGWGFPLLHGGNPDRGQATGASVPAGRLDTAVLGGDGCHRDHRRRRSPDRDDGRRPDGGCDPRADRRCGRVLLGVRHLVDSAADRGRDLETPRPAGTAHLRGDTVEHHLPAGDVRRRLAVPG